MSESQTEMRAIKQNLRLYQVNSHSQSQNLANRSIHPFSERQISERQASERQTADEHQPDRASAKTVLVNTPTQQPQIERQSPATQSPATQSPATQSPATQSQARQPQTNLPQINLPSLPTASPPLSTLPSPPPSPSSQGLPQRFTQPISDRIEADIDWEPVRPVAQAHAVAADRLQQKSVQYLQQFVQPAPKSNAQIDMALKRLEAQAQEINALSITQETAILELKAIAQQIERDWKTLEVVNAARAGYDASNVEIPSVCEYLQTSVPLVEKNQAGILVLTARSVDLFKAEREAAMTAQSLRFRAAPLFKPRISWTRKFRQVLLGQNSASKTLSSHHTPDPARGRRRKVRSWSFREGVSLLFGAVVVRVLLNLLLSAHPAFWFPAIALMVTPGAIAVYRSRVTPKLTLTWGYRLIFIMIGFWIGGRL